MGTGRLTGHPLLRLHRQEKGPCLDGIGAAVLTEAELMCNTKPDQMTICRSFSLWSLVLALEIIQMVRPWLML